MPLWLAAAPLLLASRSTVRRALLEAAGVSIEVCPADIDERALEAGVSSQPAGSVAAMLAREKASVVARRNPGRLALGADQTLSLGAQRFAKPASLPLARAQLRALAGRSHELHSAIVFAQDEAILFEHVGVARLTMRSFSNQFLDSYLKAVGSAATESVGGYQLESIGIQLFERVEGDYFTVLGLPLMEALDFLRRRGCLVT
jgi:septum formation protein